MKVQGTDGPAAWLLSYGAWGGAHPRFPTPPCQRLTQSAEKPTPPWGPTCADRTTRPSPDSCFGLSTTSVIM